MFWIFGRKARARAREDIERAIHAEMDQLLGDSPDARREAARTAAARHDPGSGSAAKSHFNRMSGGHKFSGQKGGHHDSHGGSDDSHHLGAQAAIKKSPFDDGMLNVEGPGGTAAFLKNIRSKFPSGEEFFDKSDLIPAKFQEANAWFEGRARGYIFFHLVLVISILLIVYVLSALADHASLAPAPRHAISTLFGTTPPTTSSSRGLPQIIEEACQPAAIGRSIALGFIFVGFAAAFYVKFRATEERLVLTVRLYAERYVACVKENFHHWWSEVVDLCGSAQSQQQVVRTRKKQDAYDHILTAQYVGRGADEAIDYASIVLKRAMQTIMFRNFGFRAPPQRQGLLLEAKTGIARFFLVLLFLLLFAGFQEIALVIPAIAAIAFERFRYRLLSTAGNPVMVTLKSVSLDPGVHGHYFSEVADSYRELWAMHFGDKSIARPDP